MLQFDVLLKELGGLGLSQIILVVGLSYFNISYGFNGLATVFIAYSPDVRCNVPPLDNTTSYPNLTESDILSLTTPFDPTKQTYDGCRRYGYDLQACEGDTSCVNKSYPPIKCDNGYHYDRSIFTETVVTEFDLVCENKYLNSLSTSMYYVGMMIGSLLFGNLADAFGRKLCCICTFTLALGCMFGLTFSRSVVLYILFRVGIAVFAYGTTLGTYIYIMEVVGTEWRTLCGIAYQALFTVGYMIFGGIAFNWRNWHDMMLVATIISVPFLIFSIVMPESPRWLLTNNKEKEGIKVTKMMARLNKVKLTDEIWQEARRAGEVEVKQGHGRKYSSLDLFRQKGIFIITLKVMFNWFVNSFVYYGVSLNAGELAGDLFVNNVLNGVLEFASYICCILVMDRIGRRIPLTFLLLLAGVGLLASVVVNTYADSNQDLITLGLVFAFSAKFGISGSFAVIYNLTSELYPTVLRSNGIGIASFAARIGGIIAPYVISLQVYAVWLPNTIFGVLGLIAGVLSFTFPETNGRNMMETVEEAEEFYMQRAKKKVETLSTDLSSEIDGNINAAFHGESTRI